MFFAQEVKSTPHQSTWIKVLFPKVKTQGFGVLGGCTHRIQWELKLMGAGEGLNPNEACLLNPRQASRLQP